MTPANEKRLATLLAEKREWGCELQTLRAANVPTAILLETHDMLKGIIADINALNRQRLT